MTRGFTDKRPSKCRATGEGRKLKWKFRTHRGIDKVGRSSEPRLSHFPLDNVGCRVFTEVKILE